MSVCKPECNSNVSGSRQKEEIELDLIGRRVNDSLLDLWSYLADSLLGLFKGEIRIL